ALHEARVTAGRAGEGVELARHVIGEVRRQRVAKRGDGHDRTNLLDGEEARLYDETVRVARVEQPPVASLERERNGSVVAAPVLDVNGVREMLDLGHFEAGLFLDLAVQSLERRLAAFDHSAGQGVTDPTVSLPVVAYEQYAPLRVQQYRRGNDELTPCHRPLRTARS